MDVHSPFRRGGICGSGEKEMTAKEYLSGVRRNRLHCRSLGDRLKEIENEMTGLKAITYDRDRVQVSPSNKMEELYIKIDGLSEKFAKALLKYQTSVQKAERQIGDMPKETHREILTLRYLKDGEDGRQMTFEEIACKMHKSYEWVCHLHGHALKEFERMYL